VIPPHKITLQDLRLARSAGQPMAMLTCYDFTTATHMRAAGVPSLLVGDSAASVILGHPSTLPISLDFLIELTAAVRRGHPEALLVGDLPFGSYQSSSSQAIKSMCKMIQKTNCDMVKLEIARLHLPILRRCAANGIAAIAHLGLKPQTIGLLGAYRAQGRTDDEAAELVNLALACESAGAAAILLEAVPSETARQVVEAVSVPVLGCGAGPHVHGHVVVTPDLLGLTPHRPRFVPDTTDLTPTLQGIFEAWVSDVSSRNYPRPEQTYAMKAPAAGIANPKV
jgi:3-methyl-2-oxobutanoate hydroxymethyltransferase